MEELKKAVYAMEVEVRVLTESQQEMVETFKQFIEMQTQQKLLEQEIANRYAELREKHVALKAEVHEVTNEFHAYQQKLRVINFAVDNPKLVWSGGLLVFALFYAFAIKDIRDPLLKVLGFGD